MRKMKTNRRMRRADGSATSRRAIPGSLFAIGSRGKAESPKLGGFTSSRPGSDDWVCPAVGSDPLGSYNYCVSYTVGHIQHRTDQPEQRRGWMLSCPGLDSNMYSTSPLKLWGRLLAEWVECILTVA